MTDPWDEKPKPWAVGHHHPVLELCYDKRDIDDFHKKLKEYYSPYDELLKAEPLMPLDIKSVLAKKGMPILIDEGLYKELKEKAELVVIYDKQYDNVTEYAIELEHKLEAIKKRIATYDSDNALISREKRSKARGNKLLNLDLDLLFDIKKMLEASE